MNTIEEMINNLQISGYTLAEIQKSVNRLLEKQDTLEHRINRALPTPRDAEDWDYSDGDSDTFLSRICRNLDDQELEIFQYVVEKQLDAELDDYMNHRKGCQCYSN